ncbi:hypothetical protein DIZ27_32825 [Streptomyces sp. NWU339]|uniref:hypothetical protein n=1 Tax=Streptomyces sp. NWU339 TaxID=2185284 RepID=UPI000D6754B8|nr:hypothetical protein [Streptomyces sp. NWU339]PWI06527.1 hypothetical protein DIZ27_32825 [Streptomyces sp. NWU339]
MCDVLPDGTVAATVLVEPVYDTNSGARVATRITDPVTGDPYTPTGTVTVCPAGAEQSELDVLQLCDTADDGTVTPFVRDYARDETGAIVGHTDYALDGAPYTPAGTVGQCSSDCYGCEPLVLCDVPVTGDPVAFMRVVCHDCTGVVVSVTDTELDGVTPYTPVGTVVTDCAAIKDCPTSYQTECWSMVTAQAAYDNTAGSPCGSITPNMTQCAGTWRLNSWIVNGVERVTGTPPTFTAVGCGGNLDQLHGAWAAVLATLDPDALWQAAYNGKCLWYIRTAAADPSTVYGQMILERIAGGTAGTFTLGSAQSQETTLYSKVFTQDCDGATSVQWLDAAGNEIAPPEGELTPCATAASGGTGGAGLLAAPAALLTVESGLVSTGVRHVTGTEPQDLVAEFADVQNVTLHVLAGTVAVTMTEGEAVPVPAGVDATWAVEGGSLAAAAFAGTTEDTAYLLTWTHR